MTPERIALTLATVAFGVGVSLLMLRGWRRRAARQADLPPLPAAPTPPGPAVTAAVPGLFVGTTSADDWLDRIAAHGLSHRATGWLTVHADGVLVEREPAADIWLPFPSVRSARVGEALAGKVVGKGGLLLVDWELGGRLLTSGFRADDRAEHRRLAAAISAHLPVQEAL